ncbi:MAG: hypothetical protein ACKVPX_14905 [Myxococcaceae bacterium]
MFRNLGFAVVVAVLGSACSSTLQYAVPGTERAVGADAEIVANVNPDNNITKFDIRASHLPPPARVVEGADTFVVWARRDSSQPWTRVGSLKYDPGARSGEMLEASVPETGFELIISAEVGGTPGSPSNDVVFSQVVERGS